MGLKQYLLITATINGQTETVVVEKAGIAKYSLENENDKLDITWLELVANKDNPTFMYLKATDRHLVLTMELSEQLQSLMDLMDKDDDNEPE